MDSTTISNIIKSTTEDGIILTPSDKFYLKIIELLEKIEINTRK
jgi:hypothetical protein